MRTRVRAGGRIRTRFHDQGAVVLKERGKNKRIAQQPTWGGTEPQEVTVCRGKKKGALKAPGDWRTYSPPKVIHRRRGEHRLAPPQPPVSNFGGAERMFGEQTTIWLNRRDEHAGPGRRIAHSNAQTLIWRVSLRGPAPCRKGILRTLRLQAHTCQRRTSISASIRQGPRAQHLVNH
jgi:hypothetical protein